MRIDAPEIKLPAALMLPPARDATTVQGEQQKNCSVQIWKPAAIVQAWAGLGHTSFKYLCLWKGLQLEQWVRPCCVHVSPGSSAKQGKSPESKIDIIAGQRLTWEHL